MPKYRNRPNISKVTNCSSKYNDVECNLTELRAMSNCRRLSVLSGRRRRPVVECVALFVSVFSTVF